MARRRACRVCCAELYENEPTGECADCVGVRRNIVAAHAGDAT